MKEAQFWKPFGDGVRCSLCPRKCIIAEGKNGFCHARGNRGGVLQALTYGRPCAINIDPVEKKPLFHFAPGTRCLSIATIGCNLDCGFCQNWEISHPRRSMGGSGSTLSNKEKSNSSYDDGDAVLGQDYADPEAIVEMAKANGVPGIAYTYTEPTVFFEYAYDIMKLARRAGLYNLWVSNGYTSPAPARKAARYMDAINVEIGRASCRERV